MIKKLQYDHQRDYQKVNDLLYRTYKNVTRPNWLQIRWEYMHHHSFLDKSSYTSFAVWYDQEKLVAVVSSELKKGKAYFQYDPAYLSLLQNMVIHAENNLFDEETKQLSLVTYEHNLDLIKIIEHRGYKLKESTPWDEITVIDPSQIEIKELPQDYKLVSLKQENDLLKLDRVLWRGFGNPGEPKGNTQGYKVMQSAPSYSKHLNIAIKAPNGEYASYSGAWLEKVNKVGLIEPVATDPNYRRLGLASIATLECVKRLGKLGAKLVYVDSGIPLYKALGFKKAFMQRVYTK